MNTSTQRFIAVASAAALALGLVSCASAAPGTTSPDGGSSPKIVYIQQNSGNPYFDNIASGFEAAASEYGYEFSATGPATAGASEQVPLIQDAITQQVSAIAIQASDPDAVLPALKKAQAAGIKIIAINSDQLAEVRSAAVTPVDFSEVGAQQLELMGELMGYQGDFAILSATTTAPFQLDVIAAIEQLLASDAKYADMNLVEIVYGNDEPEKSTTETAALLTKYPNLGGILSPTTVGLPAAAQAVETAGRGGSVALTGVAQPNQMRKFVEDGTVEKFQLWVPADQGYVGGALLSQLIDGSYDASPGSSFDAGTFGELTVNDDGIVFVAPAMTIFDETNIGDYDF